ncbi:glycosyltransferase family 4 protein [Geobacter sp. AOG1]|uniref:glycosyltransferase family 4 protein n=1 Tax=Geobacter sp. AOG1 TaxID=1566346 RepID=UPI001CC6A105|nr:glycosyltransferase family 4 protein [Geobacter sp. AOG1]GFE58637.1 glycosyl transferase [Geobacter sp. AOG1]
MKILLLTKYSRKGASSRLRSFQYVTYIEANGFEITIQSLFDDGYLSSVYNRGKRSATTIARLYSQRLVVLLSIFKYDLIWIEKEIFPFLPAFAERLLLLLGKAYIVDYDDAVFHNYDLSRFPVVRQLLGRKIDKVMAYANMVVCGNNYIAERASQAGAKHIEILPTVVDTLRYMPRVARENQCPVIGWIGSPSTQKYVQDMLPVLQRVCRNGRARLVLVGAQPELVSGLHDVPVEFVAWKEETESEKIACFDIGIMPLPNGPWERGKCGYKLIQYMACGLPVVASPVGVNRQIVEHGVNGFLADTPEEWESALMTLVNNPGSCLRMGQAGRQRVEERYSLQATSSRLLDLINFAVR